MGKTHIVIPDDKPCYTCGKTPRKRGVSYCQKCWNEKERKTWNEWPQWKKREKWLKHKYNITYDDYEKLHKGQNGKCAICEIKISITSNKNGRDVACVDHCHSSGIIRGLLCNHCNRGLGIFKDNINNLKKAINYLDKFPKT